MEHIISWLLTGDISIIFMTKKYLLLSDTSELSIIQKSIETRGYASVLLSSRNQNDLWGKYYYQPKWTSTHYTLLGLKNMEINPQNEICNNAVDKLIKNCRLATGGFNLAKSNIPNDNCIDGMVLNYSSYFLEDVTVLEKTVDMLLSSQKENGGFVQYTNEFTDEHATICVLEGLLECRKKSTYRCDEIKMAEKRALDYLYANNLFLENKEHKIIYFPFRYYYSIFRFLNYCVDAHLDKNSYIENAIEYLLTKRDNNGLWCIDKIYKGEVHTQLEEIKKPSRFITLMSLKILRAYEYSNI